jgi:hypothetical protein
MRNCFTVQQNVNDDGPRSKVDIKLFSMSKIVSFQLLYKIMFLWNIITFYLPTW